MVYLVGVSGGTCSGKSAVCELIIKENPDIGLFKMDCFYKSLGEVEKFNGFPNFEVLESINVDDFVKALSNIKKGETVSIPVYSRVEHRATGNQTLVPKKIMLVDGFLLFSEPRILSLLDLKIFLDVPEHIRFQRRMERTIRKGHLTINKESWNNLVEPFFQKHGNLPHKADYVVDASRPVNDIKEDVVRIIRGAVK